MTLRLLRHWPGPGGAAQELKTAGDRKLNRVRAEPLEEPTDPLPILRNLPERELKESLRQYHKAVDAVLC
jgi:hypothetical protein